MHVLLMCQKKWQSTNDLTRYISTWYTDIIDALAVFWKNITHYHCNWGNTSSVKIKEKCKWVNKRYKYLWMFRYIYTYFFWRYSKKQNVATVWRSKNKVQNVAFLTLPNIEPTFIKKILKTEFLSSAQSSIRL